MAAAYTTLFAYIVLAIVQALISKRVYIVSTGEMDETVYEDGKLLMLSAITIIICLACLDLYEHIVIRYCVIVLCIVLLILNRDKIMKLIKLSR